MKSYRFKSSLVEIFYRSFTCFTSVLIQLMDETQALGVKYDPKGNADAKTGE